MIESTKEKASSHIGKNMSALGSSSLITFPRIKIRNKGEYFNFHCLLLYTNYYTCDYSLNGINCKY